MSQVLDALVHWAAERPQSVALCGPDEVWTWRQLLEAVDNLAGQLLKQLPALGPIAVLLDNGPAWVITDLALMRLGRVCVPLPPFFTSDQQSKACAHAGVSAIIHPGGLSGALPVANERLSLSLTVHSPVCLPAGTAKITYTSGSTGEPKGVCLSLAQMEATAASLVEVLGIEHAGIHLPVLPLGVLLENVAGLYAILLAGGCYQADPLGAVGFDRPFQPDFPRMVRRVAETRASSLILAPEILRGLLACKIALDLDLPALRLVAVGGAKVSPQLLRAARAAGVPAFEGYGLSECASVVALNTPMADRAGTVGRPLPHLAVAIAADGEILVGPSPFLGYVGLPASPGPMHTGDLGRLDADGFLTVSGRRSNTLITAFARNIAPEWVESELLAEPALRQALVFGEAQAALGALLVPSRESCSSTELQAAVDRANARLPEYARVARWRQVAPFDAAAGQLTANGRPRRDVLLKTYADFTALAEESPCPSFPT